MEEKIQYRWETKEEQEQNWKLGDDRMEDSYNEDKQYYSSQENKRYTQDELQMEISSCSLEMLNYIQHNQVEWAKECAQRGIDTVEKYSTILKDHSSRFCVFSDVPYFYWLLTGREDKEQLKRFIDSGEYVVVRPRMKRFYYMTLALGNIQYGDFEKAKENIKYLYEVKPRSRLNEDVIYHLERFYAFVIEYLCEPEKNAYMLSELTKCFKLLFEEEQKGSKKLYDENVIDINKKYYVLGLRYIWYKYFSGRDWNTISPIEVLQSQRYGVKGLQDC